LLVNDIARRREGNLPWFRLCRPIIARSSVDEDRSISIVNKAVATSGAAGFRFDEQGRFNHLFDPSTGACAYPARNLTVVAATAVTADALSTAFALMDEEGIKSVLARSGDAQSYITIESGTRAITAASG